MFFYTGNEGPIESFYANTGFLFTLAQHFKAMVVFAEHVSKIVYMGAPLSVAVALGGEEGRGSILLAGSAHTHTHTHTHTHCEGKL